MDFDDGDGASENDVLVPQRFDTSGRGNEYVASRAWWPRCFHPSQINYEILQGAVVRLYYSRFTAVLYGCTLLLAAVLLMITLGLDTPLRDAPRLLLVLEGLVSLSLFTEVVLRAVVLGRDYLDSWPNIIDAVVAVASVGLMFVAAPRAEKTKNYEEEKEDVELSQTLVMARTLVQFVRLLTIANHAHRSNRAKAAEDINFSHMMEGQFGLDLDFAKLREWDLHTRHRIEDFGL